MNDDKKILQTRQRLKGSLTKVYHGKGRKEMEFPSAAFDRWKTTPPEEEEPITTDWRGGYVKKGDLIHVIDGDVVLKDDLECYVISEFAVIIDGELVFNINDTIVDPEHLTEYIESEFGPATEA